MLSLKRQFFLLSDNPQNWQSIWKERRREKNKWLINYTKTELTLFSQHTILGTPSSSASPKAPFVHLQYPSWTSPSFTSKNTLQEKEKQSALFLICFIPYTCFLLCGFSITSWPVSNTWVLFIEWVFTALLEFLRCLQVKPVQSLVVKGTKGKGLQKQQSAETQQGLTQA